MTLMKSWKMLNKKKVVDILKLRGSLDRRNSTSPSSEGGHIPWRRNQRMNALKSIEYVLVLQKKWNKKSFWLVAYE